MQNITSDERIALDGRILRLGFRSRAPFFAGDLKNDAGATAKTAPLLPTGGEYSCLLDLGGLELGVYAIVVRSSGGSVPFGRSIAKQQKRRAGAVSRTDQGNPRKIAASAFPSGKPTVFAAVYADAPTAELRLRLSASDDIDAFLASPKEGKPRPEHNRFSVVSAAFNVEKYLGDFITSITSQSLDFRSHIELIIVDDGSTDRTARIVKGWQRKHPDNIRYFRKENEGPASARNLGLTHASHEWVTFADPDDFLDKEYFAEVDRVIRKYGERLTMVSCNLVFYDETTSKERDAHPLRYRFADGEMIVPADNLGKFIQLSVNSAFLRKSRIESAELEFDGRVRPGFEDAHFVGRYLVSCPASSAAFLAQAKYLYRKRADRSSIMDRFETDPEWYGDQPRYGYLGLLKETQAIDGTVPRQVQDTVLYSLTWKLRHVVDRPETVAFLGEERRIQFRALLLDIFALIDARTIAEYDATYLAFFYRVGMLNLFKDADPPEQIVEITAFDKSQSLVRLVYWSRHATPPVSFLVDGKITGPKYAKTRRRDFLGSTFCWEHIAWLSIAGSERLRPLFEANEASISVRNRMFADGVTGDEIQAGLRTPVRPEATFFEEVRTLRRLAHSPKAMVDFHDAWLFMDRDAEADDSAEHLYRYVREHRSDINAFFVLQRDCPHWNRLAADGLRLIGFNEPEHAVALLNATYLISSQVDHYAVGYLPRDMFGDLLKHRTIFLQHGVIKDDISGWLNQVDLDLLVTSTTAEFHSIVDDGTAYKFGRKEVVLTGLPRHDALLRADSSERRFIVIMPTWRSSLTGPALGPGNARSVRADFAGSEFARRWKSVLRSRRVQDLAAHRDREIVFVPHPNLEAYVDALALPTAIKVRRFSDSQSIQDVFRRCAVLVTDYSSKAFDVALLGKPVVYYQFDPETFFGGGHLTRPGYFDYERDGFGPVTDEEEAMLDAIEASLGRCQPDSIYRERAARTFIFRDGRCCERVFQAILALDQGQPDRAGRNGTSFDDSQATSGTVGRHKIR